MRKILLACTAAVTVLSAGNASAQWTTSLGNIYSTPTTDNVGVGVTSGTALPAKFNIDGDMSFMPHIHNRRISGRSDMYLGLFGKTSQADGAGLVLGADGASGYDGIVRMISGGNPSNDVAMDLLLYNGGTHNGLFTVRKNGMFDFTNIVGWYPSIHNRRIVGRSDMYLEMFGKTSQADGAGLVLGADGASGYDGLVRMISGGGPSNDVAMDLLLYNGGAHDGLFTVRKNGMFDFSNIVGWYPSGHNRRISGRSDMYLEIYGKNDLDDGAGLVLGANGAGGYDGQIRMVSGGWSSSDVAMTLLQHNGGAFDALMHVRKDGKMVIGNVDPNTAFDYKLYVQNGILTERVKVAVAWTGDWSDYVFAEDYSLMPLNKVEEYIKENKHLPDVPSAEEVVKDGIDLGAMDAKLLQKIEELTLHVIEQQKKIEALEAKVK